MEIKDLQIGQGDIDLVAEVVDIGEVREFEKFGKKGRVATARIKDSSGEINLSLWNEDVDRVKTGQRLHLINCYVGEWQGEPQLTTGRFGKIEVLPQEETEDEALEEELLEEKTTDEGEHILTKDEKIEEEKIEEEKIGDKKVEEEVIGEDKKKE